MSVVQQAGAAYVSPQYRMRGLMGALNVTFWLQVALLASAAWSVQAAGWVESPPLAVIAFLGTLAAFLMADLKGRASVYHASATLVGLVIAYLGGVFLTEADQWYLRFGELNSRIWEWWVAVFSNDATTDSLPLSITMIAVVWMIAYFTSWMFFKRRNVWAVLLPVGTGVVINMTYLPERFYVHLFAYLFIGLAHARAREQPEHGRAAEGARHAASRIASPAGACARTAPERGHTGDSGVLPAIEGAGRAPGGYLRSGGQDGALTAERGLPGLRRRSRP